MLWFKSGIQIESWNHFACALCSYGISPKILRNLYPSHGLSSLDAFSTALKANHGGILINFSISIDLRPRFNPVRPSYSETRALMEEVLEEIVKPSLLNLNETSLHMAKCVTRAYNTDYHLLVYNHFLCKCIALISWFCVMKMLCINGGAPFGRVHTLCINSPLVVLI